MLAIAGGILIAYLVIRVVFPLLRFAVGLVLLAVLAALIFGH